MNEIAWKTLLYDFYGEMLTDHQKEIFEDYYLHDLSYGEIADMKSTSRQGVYDTIKRTDKLLEKYENKLALIERYQDNKKIVEQISKLTYSEDSKEALLQIRKLAEETLANL